MGYFEYTFNQYLEKNAKPYPHEYNEDINSIINYGVR